jgi:hypothetical protein
MPVLDFASTLLAACIIPYAIALLIPTWRWLLAFSTVAGMMLFADRSRHWMIGCPLASGSGSASSCVWFGNMLLFMATSGFTIGVVVRGLTSCLASRGLPRSLVVAICIAGGVLAPALVMVAPDIFIRPRAWLR